MAYLHHCCVCVCVRPPIYAHFQTPHHPKTLGILIVEAAIAQVTLLLYTDTIYQVRVDLYMHEMQSAIFTILIS